MQIQQTQFHRAVLIIASTSDHMFCSCLQQRCFQVSLAKDQQCQLLREGGQHTVKHMLKALRII